MVQPELTGQPENKDVRFVCIACGLEGIFPVNRKTIPFLLDLPGKGYDPSKPYMFIWCAEHIVLEIQSKPGVR